MQSDRTSLPNGPSATPTSRKLPPPDRVPVRRKLLYATVLVVALFAAGELLLALVGVRTESERGDPFVGFRGTSPLFIRAKDESGAAIYRTAPNKIGLFNDQRFADSKHPDAYRVFCTGGSTTHGRPYRDATSYVGWLRAFLEAAEPSREWEVINCGGVSYASYRVAALMEELVQHKPDLFIIYTGHNEFLEERTYGHLADTSPLLTQARRLLGRSRIVGAGAAALRRIRGESTPDDGRYILDTEVDALLDNSAGLDLYHRDDALRRTIVAHYALNLERMVEIARGAGAEVIFVEPASNLRTFSPLKSEHRAGLAESELRAWERAVSDGKDAAHTGDHVVAIAAYDEAMAIDDRYAELHYLRGRSLFALGRHAQARTAFVRAVEEDVCPLRMLPEMGDVLRKTAQRLDVERIDFAGAVAAWSVSEFGHDLPGDAYFLDHVHPTIEIHRRLGRLLFEEFRRRRIVQPAPKFDDERFADVAQEVLGRIDHRAHARARSELARVLRWAGKIEEAMRLAEQAVPDLPDHAPTLALYANLLERSGRLGEAIDFYRRALASDPLLEEALSNAPRAMIAAGEADAAIEPCRRLVALRPDDPVAMGNLGKALISAGRPGEGIDALERAVDLAPDSIPLRLKLGSALLAIGRSADALTQARAALRLDERSVPALVIAGACHRRLGAPDEAIGAYHRALAIDPDNADAHYNLGVTHLLARRRDPALGCFRRAIAANPEHADAHFNLGVVLIEVGRFDDARGHLVRAASLRDGDATPCLILGSQLQARGRYVEAIQWIREGLERDPALPELRFRMAWMLATCPVESVRDGADALRLARSLCPQEDCDDPLLLDVLAAAYAETGRFDEAEEVLERALARAEAAGDDRLVRILTQHAALVRQGQPIRTDVVVAAVDATEDNPAEP